MTSTIDIESLPKNKQRSARALEAMTAPDNAHLTDAELAAVLGETVPYIYNLRWRLNHPEAYKAHNERSILRAKVKRRRLRRAALHKQQRELEQQLNAARAAGGNTQLSLPLDEGTGAAPVTVEQMRQDVAAIVIKVNDAVNSPAHYTKGGIETIAFIKAKLSREEYIGYLRGNVLKYSSRLGDKDAMEQDAGKLAWYSRELTEFLKEGK